MSHGMGEIIPLNNCPDSKYKNKIKKFFSSQTQNCKSDQHTAEWGGGGGGGGGKNRE